MADGTIYRDKKFFEDKPLLIMGTDPFKSFYRASIRDDKTLKENLKHINDLFRWYGDMNKSLNHLSNITNAKKGQDFLNKYYKNKR